ncbi:PREDICTED: epsin-3-like isoform X1 [Cyprinodon variegatus]|uniref:Epsin 3a n=1 Tax=Cyprinodon variegatus TaxID=28743 RepID=A0A3Q2FP39_CYPVA|nr:PREDICTED: epsin-3-like isoform X1 [Cyprinodon variegatus]XP_015254019.1 PREDICTED: epsin-3-like isoform X1 [Cyprinodon variegatus]
MQSSSLRRQVKNMVNNYTEAEIKVREATSNDPWGPSASLMSDISDLTYNVVAFTEVMGMIFKRLNDHGKNWRHVYKALTLLDYLVKTGSERVVKACRDNIITIQTLKDFQYIDRDGHDQGIHVREKSKKLVALLKDDAKLKSERSSAQKTKARVGRSSAGYSRRFSGDDFNTCGSSSSFSPSVVASTSSHLDPDLEQAIPASSGEEELQLQLALAMSREESEKPPPTVDIDEQTQLQIAMKLSKEEAQKSVKRAPAPVVEMDEDAQLQLALSLSKEEHQQEQLSRRGDDTDLQKALEESKREMAGRGGTAFMDLVDIFAVPADAPPSDIRWNNTSQQAAAGATDPWDSLDNIPRADSPWMVPPSHSPPPPWEPPAYSWDGLQDNVSNPTAQSLTSASSRVDPFFASSNRTAATGAASEVPPRRGSPSDGDLFDEAMDGGPASINGQEEDSSDLFNMSGLRDSLPIAAPRKCKTPEAFLGPTAASLVDLDALIPKNPPAKTTNPFLAGLSAPSAANPFQAEQPKVSLDEMSSSFESSVPQTSSLPYSASLPLPTSHQGAAIPSSLTHPTPPGLELPVKLPEPLLPFSSASNEDTQINVNPFL